MAEGSENKDINMDDNFERFTIATTLGFSIPCAVVVDCLNARFSAVVLQVFGHVRIIFWAACHALAKDNSQKA
jgi:hypothetical protein